MADRPLTTRTSSGHLLACAVLLAVVAVGCEGSAGSGGDERFLLRMGTAFGSFSLPLAEEYKERLPHLEIKSQHTLDSNAVIAGIEGGSIDLGISLADVAYSAYWGGGEPAPQAASAVRGVVLLQPLPQYLLVPGESDIAGVSDLEGRTLVVGARTTSSYLLAPIILEAFGVTANIRSVQNRAEAAALLKEGAADAVLLPGYTYPDDVFHEAIESGAHFVPIEGPAVDRLRIERPFIRRAMIPRDIYPGQDHLIPTIGIDMVVVCRRDLPDAVVYDLTAALMSAYPQLSGVEANLRFLNPDEAAATPIPLHPGAARYFRERELSR